MCIENTHFKCLKSYYRDSCVEVTHLFLECSREMSSEMGDNHGNFDIFRLDSSVRIKTRIRTEVT